MPAEAGKDSRWTSKVTPCVITREAAKLRVRVIHWHVRFSFPLVDPPDFAEFYPRAGLRPDPGAPPGDDT